MGGGTLSFLDVGPPYPSTPATTPQVPLRTNARTYRKHSWGERRALEKGNPKVEGA